MATSDDIPAVLQLWEEADAEPTHTDDVASLRRLLAHDPAALIVAVDGGRVIGSIVAAWDGWRGSIYRLAVAPDRRRERLGRHLLAAAEVRLGDLGAVRLQAIVVETDDQASAFWLASGWEAQTARRRFVRGLIPIAERLPGAHRVAEALPQANPVAGHQGRREPVEVDGRKGWRARRESNPRPAD